MARTKEMCGQTCFACFMVEIEDEYEIEEEEEEEEEELSEWLN